MANQQSVNSNTIKSTVIIDFGLKSVVRNLRHLLTVVLKSKRLKKCKIKYAQIKMYFVKVKIFFDDELHTTD